MTVERIGRATLYLGDCRSYMEHLQEAAAVVTDPPFGIAYRSGHATPDLWAGECIEGDATTDVRDQVIAALGDLPMLVFGSWKAPRPVGTRAVLTWDKGPALGMGALDIPWKPSSEEIYVLGRGWVGRRDEGAVIYCPPVQSMASNGRVHPNQKPTTLLSKLLLKCPPGMIADPFMGSGSTGVAAVTAGRAFVGCEVDPRYFGVACRRLEEVQRQADMFIGDPAHV